MYYLYTMAEFPKKLQAKLSEREMVNALRKLQSSNELVDFSSNDYLGLAKREVVFNRANQLLKEQNLNLNGATGSRLLTGNHRLYDQLEKNLCEFHKVQSALVFTSGYDANIGFFSAVPQRGDIVFYDEYIHASIRDGIKMGNAKSYKFKHNDLEDLKSKIPKPEQPQSVSLDNEVYIVTESVFSMDGDSPDLKLFSDYCKSNGFHLVVDEAHAVGIFGTNGEGLVQELGLQDQVFARIITFGKAMGCHGAAILGSVELTSFLVNFARSFIYTTGLSPHSVATIISSYEKLILSKESILNLNDKILLFKRLQKEYKLETYFIASNSAIQCCRIKGNENVKRVAHKLQEKGYDVKPIISPTVPIGEERLRFCLHAFNTREEIKQVLGLLHSTI
ncbi:MAG: pyridoxal phosphate-dependent aminotransferase family protein [Maribacter sp.]